MSNIVATFTACPVSALDFSSAGFFLTRVEWESHEIRPRGVHPLLTKTQKMKKYEKVTLELFDIEQLLKAAEEGRLFIMNPEHTCCSEVINNKIRTYVARIRSLVNVRYRDSIDDIWDEILQNELLFEVVKPKPKARKFTDFDKYGVMRIIGVMRENGVYDSYNDLYIDAILEQPGKDSPYRKYLGLGLNNRAEILALRRILEHQCRF